MSRSEFTWKDDLAITLANWILTHLASKHYRALLQGSIRLGMATALVKTDKEINEIMREAQQKRR